MTRVPELRFAGFDGEWAEKKIKNISTINSGKDYKHLQSGDIPVYGTGGLMTHVNEYLSDRDSIGIGRKGTINRPYILNHPFWTVDTLFFTTPNIETNLYFLYGIYQNINWLKYDESSGLPSLSKKNIENLVVSAPNVKEQEKIGGLFSKIDQLIESQQELVDQTIAFKKSMLQKMFPNKDSLVPEFRFDGFLENWNLVKLKELGDIDSSGVDKKYKEGEDKVYLLNYMDVYNKKYPNLENLDTFMITTANKSQLQNKDVKKGDIYFTPSSETAEDIGHSMVIKDDITKMVYSYHVYRFRPKSNNLCINFSNYFANIEPVRHSLKYKAQGAQRYTLKLSDFRNLNVKIPSIEEQEKIGNFFKKLDEKVAREERLLESYKDMKKSLLQKMFV